jgi:hypothetical protein
MLKKWLSNIIIIIIIIIMVLQPFAFGLGSFFSVLIIYTIGRTPWTGDRPVARPLATHRTIQTQNKRTQTFMPWVGFEPTIPAFERAKTVHASDRAATVIGYCQIFFFVWRYNPNLGLGLPPWNSPFHFGFLDLRHSVGLPGRVIS